MEQQLKSGKKEKGKKRICSDVLKQSGKAVESVLKKKRKGAMGRICRKGRF